MNGNINNQNNPNGALENIAGIFNLKKYTWYDASSRKND